MSVWAAPCLGDATKTTVGKLSYAGWIPHDRGSFWGCLALKDERRRCRLITGTRVPHRVLSPTLRIGRVEVSFFSVSLPRQVLAGVTVRAIAQTKPAKCLPTVRSCMITPKRKTSLVSRPRNHIAGTLETHKRVTPAGRWYKWRKHVHSAILSITDYFKNGYALNDLDGPFTLFEARFGVLAVTLSFGNDECAVGW